MGRKRYLTEGEIALLTEIYGERDYFYQTTIERGNWVRPKFGLVSNNNITVGRTPYSNDFSQTASDWFVHEGAHLVQEQTFGKHLIGGYFRGELKSPFRSYNYSDEVRKGIPFEQMGTEAQASIIADYYRAVQGYRGRYVNLPIKVYQRIIPESYVPSFGRSRKDTTRHGRHLRVQRDLSVNVTVAMTNRLKAFSGGCLTQGQSQDFVSCLQFRFQISH